MIRRRRFFGGLTLTGARRRPARPGADEPPAARTKLRLVPVQAGPDAVDVRNLGAAQAKRVACTRLLPFGRVGLCCRRQQQDRKRRCQHQTELEISGPCGNHESPQAFIRELWVKDGGLATRRGASEYPAVAPGGFFLFKQTARAFHRQRGRQPCIRFSSGGGWGATTGS